MLLWRKNTYQMTNYLLLKMCLIHDLRLRRKKKKKKKKKNVIGKKKKYKKKNFFFLKIFLKKNLPLRKKKKKKKNNIVYSNLVRLPASILKIVSCLLAT